MPKPPAFPFTRVSSIDKWFNFHHTIADRAVPLYLTPDALVTASADTPPGPVRQAQALTAILDYCMKSTPPERLCILGSKWSLSDVLDPANVILDPGAFNKIARVNANWLTKAYRDEAKPRGGVAIVAQGGAEIGVINQRLGEAGLALQTSGAADGHRLAGCIATATHGSALGVGAVHDTVLAIYLVTEPGKGVLLQPARRPFTEELAHWFETNTTLSTTDLADDELFDAARVALGSLGFVHSVVIEAVPLYQLEGTLIARPLYDAEVWNAIETLDTTALSKRPEPYNFAVMLSPYSSGAQPGAFTTLLWKRKPKAPFAGPSPATSMIATDTSRFLSHLIGKIDSALASSIVEHILVDQSQQAYKPGPIAPLFPGQIFGPTTLPPGNGRSTEIVIDHAHAGHALRTVLEALRSEGRKGRHLLGVVGVRFASGSSALLAMNIHKMNMYIELPSLGSPDIPAVHQACWDALTKAKIPFTCHWGQEYGIDAASVAAYYGERSIRWKAARSALLATPAARSVFATPIAQALGLA